MISIAVNIIFLWVLGLTLQVQSIKAPPIEKPAVEEKEQPEKPAAPVEPTTLPPPPAPL